MRKNIDGCQAEYVRVPHANLGMYIDTEEQSPEPSGIYSGKICEKIKNDE